MTKGNPLTIVLAEDDDGHATLIRRNFHRTGLEAEILRARGGREAIETLRAEIGPGKPRRPILLLLDISMPGMDGAEVLREIKRDADLRWVPVYMLTTTDNPFEIERCFELGCNAYLTKPISYEAFSEVIERLSAFLAITKFPAPPKGRTHASA